jgi:hypothetical protein
MCPQFKFFSLGRIALISLMISLAAGGAELCPTFVSRLSQTGPHSQKIEGLLARKGIKRFYSTQETRPIVEQIAKLGKSEFNRSFALSGNAREEGGTLIVELDGIGPPVGKPLPPSSIKDNKATMAGLPNPFVSQQEIGFHIAKAVSAVFEGIERRLLENPTIKKIRIETIDVANSRLKFMLMGKMGFKLISARTIGLSTSADTYLLELDLDPVPQ